MSLRLAALDAYALLEQLFTADFQANPAIDSAALKSYRIRGALRDALGFSGKSDAALDQADLVETIAESLARDPDTALLAGALIRAVGQHRAERLVPEMLAQAAK